MAHVFPERFRKFLTEWKIPAMVLFSLVLRSVLILMGSRRKYSTKIWLRFIPWLAYLLADWVAALSLSLISNFRDDDSRNPKYSIRAFWAPFLLLHLGGQDTITAYSLEDNELWWRNTVIHGGQVVVASYILLNAWSSNELNFLSIPIFFAGIVKLGERIRSLMCASSEHFRKSLLPSPDPGPNYARYMDEYSSKKAEGFMVFPARINEAPTIGHYLHSVPANTFIPYAANLQDAYYFLQIFKRLFADLILSGHDIVNSQLFFQNRPCEEVFRVIEIELGFMYDLFYTKAVVIYSVIGGILRFLSFSFVVAVLMGFSIIRKRDYSPADVIVTFILLAGAIVHEIVALCLLLRSDWTMLWLTKQKNRAANLLYKAISLIPPLKKKRCSNKIAQYNLIRVCLKDKPPKCSPLEKVHCFYDDFKQNYFHKSLGIPKELKEIIFKRLLQKSTSALDFSTCKKLCSERGRWVLQEERCLDKLCWSIESAEFDQSILLWHIATDLCYYSDLYEISSNSELKRNSNPDRHHISKDISKLLSEYMLHILVMRPFMLPNGIGQIRFQDTCAEAIEFFKERRSTASAKKAACEALLRVSTEIPTSQVKGDRSKSVLFEACKLAKDLQSLETEPNWNKEKKWELISHVWVEILSYAASQCQRNQHLQQLRRGGELLTHVWLLMAHLGITAQFQISDGHARTKLIVQ
ncbi:uncharacterized protein LOC112094556 [Morus notabilis]|uniref:uncharacterized protein LOC112094556 n=1 Tax=Morus notabilis TaxID=981085 RepID=UPI000CECE3C3|nr:uncharacterized protein LOC112094556 [Morus notabilis]